MTSVFLRRKLELCPACDSEHPSAPTALLARASSATAAATPPRGDRHRAPGWRPGEGQDRFRTWRNSVDRFSGKGPGEIRWTASPRPAGIQDQHCQELVSLASAAGPAEANKLDANEAGRGSLAPSCLHRASLASTAPKRQNPRQEPSAVAPLAGICAGGGPSPSWTKGRPYRDH